MCNYGIEYLYAARIIQGIFSGLAFPSINCIYAKWTPPFERSRASGNALSGCFVGTVIAMLFSGFLAETLGWESIFYVFGVAGCVWTIIWFAIVRESPDRDCWILQDEKDFIRASLERESQKKCVHPPWRAILTSRPVFAIAIAHMTYTYGFYTLVTLLPAYMKNILHFDMQSTGYISAIPYIVKSVLLLVSGYLADRFQQKQYLSVTQVRKYFTNVSFLVVMIFLLLAAYLTNTAAVIFCITMSVGLSSFSVSGFLANPLDIAPQFASIIVGISNTFGTLPGVISPILTGYIVTTPVSFNLHFKKFGISNYSTFIFPTEQ